VTSAFGIHVTAGAVTYIFTRWHLMNDAQFTLGASVANVVTVAMLWWKFPATKATGDKFSTSRA
jgi:hypothetical protein